MIPTPSLHKFSLPNGLRVVVAPDETVPVAAVSVHYDVGTRTEPEGYSGFAHLFEHLMFGGSESAPKGLHPSLIKSTGGVLNATTHSDFTVYFNTVPAEAFATALFLEADRMRAPLLDEAELRTCVGIVKEETLSNYHNKPYGAFPSRLKGALYQLFSNSHDGWGDFPSLERATLDNCVSFFEGYYRPGNAVVTITGAVTVDQAEQLVAEYFGDISARPAPSRPSLDEPAPAGEPRMDLTDPLAPVVAVAAGYRMPEPTNISNYLAHIILADVLAQGDSSRLRQRLMFQQALAHEVSAGPLDGVFFARHPDTLSVNALLMPGVEVDQMLDVVDAELNRLAQHPPTTEEVFNAIARWKTAVCLQYDNPLERAKGLGLFEVLHGGAELLPEMPAWLSMVTADHVSAAATKLCSANRAILTVSPAGGPA